MAISTINQAGLNAPLTLTSPVLTTPNLGTPSALVLTNATALPKAALPTGCVLQVVMGTATAGFSTTSTSYVATNLSATITPTSATSKILIFFTGPSYSLSVNYAFTTVYRNGTTNLGIGASAGLAVTGNNPGTYDTSVTGMYLDSPATTSAITYTVYLKTSASTAYFGDSGNIGQVMILQEIAG
jgi:hypothetical protein